MPKWKCVCDNVISLSEIPCPNEWLYVADTAYDAAVERGSLLDEAGRIVPCARCGRIVFFSPSGVHVATYQLEQGAAAAAFPPCPAPGPAYRAPSRPPR